MKPKRWCKRCWCMGKVLLLITPALCADVVLTSKAPPGQTTETQITAPPTQFEASEIPVTPPLNTIEHESEVVNFEPKTQSPGIQAKSLAPYQLSNTHKLTTPALETKKTRQYQLQGYLNNKYVYLVVEKTKDKQIVGYLFDAKGKKKYIYGEWANNNALQIYTPDNTKATVLLNEATMRAVENLPPEPANNPDKDTKASEEPIHNTPVHGRDSLIILQ